MLFRRSVEQKNCGTGGPAALPFPHLPGGKKVKQTEYNLLYYTGSADGRQAPSFPFSRFRRPRRKMKLLFSAPGFMMRPERTA
jgi:hypothetical protein